MTSQVYIHSVFVLNFSNGKICKIYRNLDIKLNRKNFKTLTRLAITLWNKYIEVQ